MSASSSVPQRKPVRENLLSEGLSNLDSVRLLGSRCRVCHETALGVGALCQNCGSDSLSILPLGTQGTLWTYTIVHHKPPGDYRGPDPFAPFGLGLVELPEGIRVLSPIGGRLDALKIGQAVGFRPTILAGESGTELIGFEFVPLDQA